LSQNLNICIFSDLDSHQHVILGQQPPKGWIAGW